MTATIDRGQAGFKILGDTGTGDITLETVIPAARMITVYKVVISYKDEGSTWGMIAGNFSPALMSAVHLEPPASGANTKQGVFEMDLTGSPLVMSGLQVNISGDGPGTPTWTYTVVYKDGALSD